MEGMGTREQIEHPTQNRLIAQLTHLVTSQVTVTCLQTPDFLPDLLCRQGEFLHFLLEVIYLIVVISQRVDDAVFVLVDNDEIREPGKEVINLEEVAFIEQSRGGVDVFLVLRVKS